MKRRSRKLKVRKEHDPNAGQGGFNFMMGAGGARSALSRFTQKNPQSTNSISTYNPFMEMLSQTGADDV